MTRVGAEWEARSRDSPRDVENVKEGKRGGVGETGEEAEDGEGCLGRSGKVMDGAGFGEGMVRRESREMRTRSGRGAKTAWEGLRFKLAERRDCDSARSRDRKERY